MSIDLMARRIACGFVMYGVLSILRNQKRNWFISDNLSDSTTAFAQLRWNAHDLVVS